MKLSTILTIFFALATIAVPLIAWRYTQKKKQSGIGKLRENEKEENQEPLNVKEYLPLKDIWGNMAVLDKSEYVMYVKTGAENYHLMSEAEQNRFEIVLLQVVNQFKYPVQFYARAPMVDVTPVYETMNNNLPNLPNDAVKIYTAHLIEELDMVAHRRNVLDRERYLVLNYKTVLGKEKAKGELERRANSLIRSLDKANIKAKILETGEISDFLHGVLNRGQMFKPSRAVNAGGLELAVTGRGGFGVFKDNEKDTTQEKIKEYGRE